MEYKILNTIGSKFTPAAKAILAKVGQVDYRDLNQSDLNDVIDEYDGALIGLGLNFNREVIEQGQRLKFIATATTGTDHIDTKLAGEKGIVVMSLKDDIEFLKTITGTAELAFGLLLDLARHISAGFASVKNYEWDRERFRGHNLAGKVLGVVGYGRLGKMMARYGAAFGMKVLVVDPHFSKADLEAGVKLVNWDDLLKESDIISIHVHLTEETKEMFNQKSLAMMKPGVLLINTARGQIVNEADVLAALESGQLAGYATDVLAEENKFNIKFNNQPLVEYAKTHDNCLIVPHIGGMTFESREATDIFMAKKVAEWCKNFKD